MVQVSSRTEVALPAAAAAWREGDRERFATLLCRELAALPSERLPLIAALERGSAVGDGALRPSLLAVEAVTEGGVEARVGLFFSSIIAGCACADDPTPPDEITEYCELRLNLARSGHCAVELVNR